jgi:CTP:molybdopterin cytidylyltransferase MocA
VTATIGILAAGGSTRMRGRDKLIEEVDGETLLARQLRIASETGAPVLVALPPGDGPRQAIAAGAGARILSVADPSRGMSASIATLAAEAGRLDAAALMLLLADMPDLETVDLVSLLSAAEDHPDSVVRAATAEGRPGHPVVFPRSFFDALQRLQGDAGARQVVAMAQDVRLVRLAGDRARVDLDTPEAWEAWRSQRR